MKPKGRHPDRALTAIKVKALSVAGRYADGNGLYLMVDPSGAKRWVLRTVFSVAVATWVLEGAQLVSLAEAREKAVELRKVARAGGDPVADKARAFVPTFEEAARTAHGEHVPAWKNGKHTAQWLNTLAEYAFPTIGNRRVNEIETPEVRRVLSPIWLSKPETARRVKQRMGTVLDWAKAAGYRSGTIPFLEWRRAFQDSRSGQNIMQPCHSRTCQHSSVSCGGLMQVSPPSLPLSSSSSPRRAHRRCWKLDGARSMGASGPSLPNA